MTRGNRTNLSRVQHIQSRHVFLKPNCIYSHVATGPEKQISAIVYQVTMLAMAKGAPVTAINKKIGVNVARIISYRKRNSYGKYIRI